MTKQTFLINGIKDKKILLDITSNSDPKGLIIFVHGFKGFKDWGTHHLVADYFARNGYSFLKFNFSHNGTTIDNPLEFGDLEAFGHNTITMEIDELDLVINYSLSGRDFPKPKRIFLIGHSKGGGISIIQTAKDKRIDKLITWASTANFRHLWKKGEEEAWEKKGMRSVCNFRTHQKMPMYKVILEDYLRHENELNILNKAATITQAWLIVHGSKDPSVSFNRAEMLQQANPKAELFAVQNSNHVFGGSHPYVFEQLPPDLKLVCKKCLEFLNT